MYCSTSVVPNVFFSMPHFWEQCGANGPGVGKLLAHSTAHLFCAVPLALPPGAPHLGHNAQLGSAALHIHVAHKLLKSCKSSFQVVAGHSHE